MEYALNNSWVSLIITAKSPQIIFLHTSVSVETSMECRDHQWNSSRLRQLTNRTIRMNRIISSLHLLSTCHKSRLGPCYTPSPTLRNHCRYIYNSPQMYLIFKKKSSWKHSTKQKNGKNRAKRIAMAIHQLKQRTLYSGLRRSNLKYQIWLIECS